jgi:REP element-mobilizing transposase RayT
MGAPGPSPLGTGDGGACSANPSAGGASSQCMKGKRVRYQEIGEFHFLTFSCYRRQPYLSAVAARELFEDALERVRRRSLFAVAGYIVMPEHVHLLVNEPRCALLSRAIQALKLSVSMRSRERPFGRPTIMTSMFPRTGSSWKSCVPSIATRFAVDWSRRQRIGSGRAFVTIKRACAEP